MLSLDDDERTDQVLARRWRGSIRTSDDVLIEAFDLAYDAIKLAEGTVIDDTQMRRRA